MLFLNLQDYKLKLQDYLINLQDYHVNLQDYWEIRKIPLHEVIFSVPNQRRSLKMTFKSTVCYNIHNKGADIKW